MLMLKTHFRITRTEKGKNMLQNKQGKTERNMFQSNQDTNGERNVHNNNQDRTEKETLFRITRTK